MDEHRQENTLSIMDLQTLSASFQTANWATEFAQKLPSKPTLQLDRADCDYLAKQASAQLAKGRVGRARNWIALGLYLDSTNVVSHFRRVGLFRPSKYGFQGKILSRLVDGILETRAILRLDSETSRYLESVRSLSTLSLAALQTYQAVVKQFRKRPHGALKSLVATVDRMFLVPRPVDHQLNCDHPGAYSVQEHAEALSFLIHTFAKHAGIDDRQFDLIDERGLEDGVYEQLLVSACKLRAYQEAELLVDVFSYSVSVEEDAIHLRPGDARLEQSIRLGYIHVESQQTLSQLGQFADEDEPIMSIKELSKQVSEALGTQLVRRRERPFPRYALFFPEDVDKLLKLFRGDALFKEDVLYLDTTAKEHYSHSRALADFQLTEGITLLDIVKIRRFLNFLRELMAQKLLPLLESDPKIVIRSLLPVLQKQQFLRLLGQCVSREAAEEFLRIATYDHATSRRFFDVLYQPLIQGRDHYLVPINVLCSSNMLRNLLYTQRKKVQESNSDSPMQHLVAGALRARFPQLAENKKLRFDGSLLEIDIVTIVERKLLLIECKDAFHPCGLHELRTSYDHVRKARKQIDRLRRVLQIPDVLHRLCTSLQWDVNAVDGILTCIVTGNRIFNGYTIGDHPIRPAYEMINMLVAGTVQIQEEKFCVWRKSQFEPQDLLDYLAGTTVYDDLFGAFVPAERSYKLGGLTMNIGTHVLDAGKVVQSLRSRYRKVR